MKCCCTPTLLHTPVELSQDVIQQDIVEGLEVLGEDVADGIKCMVAGGGHPLCFLRMRGSHGETRIMRRDGVDHTKPLRQW